MVRRYVPDAGDIVWLYFDPQAGHEQAGHRPAVVVKRVMFEIKDQITTLALWSV